MLCEEHQQYKQKRVWVFLYLLSIVCAITIITLKVKTTRGMQLFLVKLEVEISKCYKKALFTSFFFSLIFFTNYHEISIGQLGLFKFYVLLKDE